MDSLVKVGHDVAAVKAAKDSIIEILNARADQVTIQLALGCLKESLAIGATTFNNCYISNAGTAPIPDQFTTTPKTKSKKK
jgi:hypothetical protein